MSASWQTYKGAGNDAFRASQLQTAIEQYTLALKEDDVPQAERATILANRAQCYLKLGENGPAVDDCTACLTLSPGNLKALFRRLVHANLSSAPRAPTVHSATDIQPDCDNNDVSYHGIDVTRPVHISIAQYMLNLM